MNIVASTTWNSAQLVTTFLDHYQKLGFDRALVMDFSSTDGTLELLKSSRYLGFVQIVPCPGIAGLDSSSILLDLAKKTLGVDASCLFCDPDELLIVPPDTSIAALIPESAGAITIPRFNVTGRLSAVLSEPWKVHALGSLNLRIDRRCTRDIPVDIERDSLNPPWIYTAIPGKVFVRLQATVAIGEGDHSAKVEGRPLVAAPPGIYFLHFPFRTYEDFQEKVRMNEVFFSANLHLPEAWGWQSRRWVRIARLGQLREEFLSQFVSDEEVERLIEDKALALDDNVRAIHSRGIAATKNSNQPCG